MLPSFSLQRTFFLNIILFAEQKLYKVPQDAYKKENENLRAPAQSEDYKLCSLFCTFMKQLGTLLFSQSCHFFEPMYHTVHSF